MADQTRPDVSLIGPREPGEKPEPLRSAVRLLAVLEAQQADPMILDLCRRLARGLICDCGRELTRLCPNCDDQGHGPGSYWQLEQGCICRHCCRRGD